MEKCSVCGEEFETEEELLKHDRKVHAGSAGTDESEEDGSKPEQDEPVMHEVLLRPRS